MTKETSTEPIEQHSGKSWQQWVQALDQLGARHKQHSEIAKLALQIINDGWWNIESQPNTGWWAQGISIAYEQHVGLRAAGQQSDGLYAATISKTLSGSLQDLFASWAEFAAQYVDAEPRTSHTPKRSYWRANLSGGTKVEVAFEPKPGNKVLVSISESKIADNAQVEPKKAHWQSTLESFTSFVQS